MKLVQQQQGIIDTRAYIIASLLFSQRVCPLPLALNTTQKTTRRIRLMHISFQVDKDEELRFSLLVEAFGDADSSGVALVTDLIVFFNTILSSAFEFEERVMIRTEMIAAGILDAMQRIRDYFNLFKVSYHDQLLQQCFSFFSISFDSSPLLL